MSLNNKENILLSESFLIFNKSIIKLKIWHFYFCLISEWTPIKRLNDNATNLWKMNYRLLFVSFCKPGSFGDGLFVAGLLFIVRFEVICLSSWTRGHCGILYWFSSSDPLLLGWLSFTFPEILLLSEIFDFLSSIEPLLIRSFNLPWTRDCFIILCFVICETVSFFVVFKS